MPPRETAAAYFYVAGRVGLNHKIMQKAFRSAGGHQIAVDAVSFKVPCAYKQDIRGFVFTYLIVECRSEVFLGGVRHNDEFLLFIKILLKDLLSVLKEALASFIESEAIGTGVIAVIRHDELRDAAGHDRFVNPA